MKPINKKNIIIMLIILIIIAGIVALVTFNSPAERKKRLLNLGEKYLSELDYENALTTYDQVIMLDKKCIEAYRGGIEARLELNNKDTASFYSQALNVVSGIEKENEEAEKDNIIFIYHNAHRVYENNDKMLCTILEKGAEQYEYDDIEKELQDCYLRLATKYEENKDYANALDNYSKASALDEKTKEKTYDQLCSCIKKYIDELLVQEKFETIRDLYEAYGKTAESVDFESVLDEVEKREQILMKQEKFLKKVYQCMSAENYEAMMEIDGSDEAREFVSTMSSTCQYYSDQTSGKEQLAVGVCCFGDNGYYFYYGQINDGIKSGKGTSFIKTRDNAYEIYTGDWSNDMPNGNGELMIRHVDEYTRICTGELINGLWEGHIDSTLVFDTSEHVWNMDFDAQKGIPENITQRLYDEGVFYEGKYSSGSNSEAYNGVTYKPGFSEKDLDIPEGYYLYAFDIDMNAPDIDFIHPNAYAYSNGTPMGIAGFAK